MLFSSVIHNYFHQRHGATRLWIFYKQCSYKHVQTIASPQALKFYWFLISPKCLASSYHQIVNQNFSDLPLSCNVAKNLNLMSQLRESPPYIKFNLKVIKEATVDDLDENDALFLLSLCEKRINSDSSNQVKQAELIFKASKTKSIELFNQLLKVYIENDCNINPSIILSRLKEIKLMPNKKTYFYLIAGLCLKGDVNGAIEIAKISNYNLINDIYGYMTFGLCKYGQPSEAIKFFDKAMASSFSVDAYSWLLAGLVESKSFDLFHLTVEKYSNCLEKKLSINHVLKVYKKLIKHENYNDIEKIIPYMTVEKSDFFYAINHLQDEPLQASAFFMKCLCDEYEGTFDFCESSPLKIILTSYLNSGLTLDQFYSKIEKFRKFYTDPQFIDYFTLSMIAKEQPWLLFDYLLKLKKKDINLTYPLPSHLSEIIYLPPQLIKFLSNIDYFYENSQFQSVIKSLEFALFTDCVYQLSIENIFGVTVPNSTYVQEKIAKFSEFSNLNLILNSFIFFFKKHGCEKWSMSKLSKLLHDLHDAGFRLTEDDLDYLRMFIEPKHAFLDCVIACYGNTANLASSKHFRVSLNQNQLSKIFGGSSKINLSSDLNAFDTKSFMQGIKDIVVDDNDAFNLDILKYMAGQCNKHQTILPNLVNFLFCQYLSSGDIDWIETFVSKIDKDLIDVKFEIIPSSILINKNVALNTWLLSFLKEKYGNDYAMWVYFVSFLKAGMDNIAFKILKKNLQIVTNENCEKFLLALCGESNFPNYVTTFFQECKNLIEFQPNTFYLNAVDLLLQQKRFQEAKKLLSSVNWSEKSHTIKELHGKFLKHYQYPPYHSIIQDLKELKFLIDKENFNKKHFYLHLNNLMQKNWKIHISLLSFILVNFYKKIPVDEYESTSNEIKAVFPSFQPSLQSQILLNQIEKLCKKKSFDKAFQFADKNLEKCNAITLNTWTSAVHLLANSALIEANSNALQKLQSLCSKALPEIQTLVSSYMFYWRLKSEKLQGNDEQILDNFSDISMSDLISLISSNNDLKSFVTLKKIVVSLSASKPELLKDFLVFSVLNNFEVDQIIGLFDDKRLSSDSNLVTAVADLCYSIPDNVQKLFNIDQFFRGALHADVETHSTLNHLLFQNFASLCKNGPVNENQIQYLTKQYHIIPSYQNSLYSQMVFVDLVTNVKFGCLGNNNHFCIYH